MSTVETLRGGQIMIVRGKAFRLHDLIDATRSKLAAAGCWDNPPMFYSGSPYADALLSLGAPEVAIPTAFRAEFLPHTPQNHLPYFGVRSSAWASILGCEDVARAAGDIA